MAPMKSPQHSGTHTYYRINLSFATPQEANQFETLSKFYAKTYNLNRSSGVLRALMELKLIPQFQDETLRQDVQKIKTDVNIIRQIVEDEGL
jgi:hypothetical protein